MSRSKLFFFPRGLRIFLFFPINYYSFTPVVQILSFPFYFIFIVLLSFSRPRYPFHLSCTDMYMSLHFPPLPGGIEL